MGSLLFVSFVQYKGTIDSDELAEDQELRFEI